MTSGSGGRTVRLIALLALLAVFGSGCKTAIGNYFANRGRDFGECWRAEIGLGAGWGAGARALGLVDTGITSSNFHRGLTAGWVYGEALPDIGTAKPGFDTELTFAVIAARSRQHKPSVFAIAPPGAHATSVISPWEYGLGAPALLPALFSSRDFTGPNGTESAWIWSPPPPVVGATLPPPRWWTNARLHAFDIEAHAFAFFVGVRVGFSPGQFLDFLLGWFGADIAGDDTAWKPPPQ